MSLDHVLTLRRCALSIGVLCAGAALAGAAPAGEVRAGAAVAPPAPAAETLASVLERARGALGWERIPPAGAVRVRGAARLRGTDAVQTVVFDRRGRSLQTFEGPLPHSGGFDGTRCWSSDWSGTGQELFLGDLAQAEVSMALLTGSWSAPSARLEFVSSTAREGSLTLAFVHASGLIEGLLELDPATYLPRTARFGPESHPSSWAFSGFADHHGFRFPAYVSLEQAGLTSSLATETVELLGAVEDELFEPRLAPPSDTRFADDVPAALEVKRVPTGHLLVHPTVDGQDLGWFIFDTGAGANCISTHVADKLAEGPFGAIPARGVGGTALSHFWRGKELALGPVTIADPVFVGFDLEFLKEHFGVDVAGIVGFELLARCTVEFDLAAASIALFDPTRYELRAAGRWEKAVLSDRHPCVRATVEGREGVFKIDTGAAGDTLTLHSPIVAELKLTEGRATQASMAQGVGGSVALRTGRLESFVFGGRDFGAIPASFAIEDKGAFGDRSTWGNIGGKLLEPFVLVFDYPRTRIGFVAKDAAD